MLAAFVKLRSKLTKKIKSDMAEFYVVKGVIQESVSYLVKKDEIS